MCSAIYDELQYNDCRLTDEFIYHILSYCFIMQIYAKIKQRHIFEPRTLFSF